MRRLIPTKDATFIQNLQLGVKAAPFPQTLTITYDTLFRDLMEETVSDIEEDIDWENHSIDVPVIWYFYPSTDYEGGAEAAYDNDVYTGIYVETGIEFPETITTTEQLVDYLMQGIPVAYLSDAKIDEVMYYLTDEEGNYYSYAPDDTIIADDGKSMTADMIGMFPAVKATYIEAGQIKGSTITSNMAKLESGTLTVQNITTFGSDLNINKPINLGAGQRVKGLRLPVWSHTETHDVTSGAYYYTDSSLFATGQIGELQLKFFAGEDAFNVVFNMLFTEPNAYDRPLNLIVPVSYYVPGDDEYYFGHLKVLGYLVKAGNRKCEISVYFYDKNGQQQTLVLPSDSLEEGQYSVKAEMVAH